MKQNDKSIHGDHQARAFITERDLSCRWKVSIRTLQRWRSARYGPPWVTIGGSVRYSMADLLAYEAAARSEGRS